MNRSLLAQALMMSANSPMLTAAAIIGSQLATRRPLIGVALAAQFWLGMNRRRVAATTGL